MTWIFPVPVFSALRMVVPSRERSMTRFTFVPVTVMFPPWTPKAYLQLVTLYQPGVYYDYRVLYEVHASGDPVSITIVQQGTKAGPDDSSSTPSISGVGEGNLTVSATDNGIPVGMAQVLVSANLPVPVPDNTTATTPGVPETTGAPGASGTPPTSPTPPAMTSTQPPTTAMVTTAPAGVTPSPVPVDTQPPDWFFTMITGFALVIIVISVIADYLIMRD